MPESTQAPTPATIDAAKASINRGAGTLVSAEFALLPQFRHFIPTGVTTMQSGQIGVPHAAHVSAVSLFGCLAQYVLGSVVIGGISESF
jgi:hypothetical protein